MMRHIYVNLPCHYNKIAEMFQQVVLFKPPPSHVLQLYHLEIETEA